MDNARFLKIAIIVLLLINMGTLAFIWFGKAHEMPPPPREERGPYNFLVRELNLTNEQQQKYQNLRDEHHRAMEEFNSHSRELHDRYFDLLHAESVDSALVERLADSIAANQKQEELLTFHHFQQVRAICTREQQKKFDEVIDEALHKMGPKPPPR